MRYLTQRFCSAGTISPNVLFEFELLTLPHYNVQLLRQGNRPDALGRVLGQPAAPLYYLIFSALSGGARLLVADAGSGDVDASHNTDCVSLSSVFLSLDLVSLEGEIFIPYLSRLSTSIPLHIRQLNCPEYRTLTQPVNLLCAGLTLLMGLL